jgi:Selenocysteine synthase N terminal
MDARRLIPAVDRVLESPEFEELRQREPRERLRRAVQHLQAEVRAALERGESGAGGGDRPCGG